MKRTLISLFSLLGLAMAVTSCQKDESVAKFSASMEPTLTQDGKTLLNGTGLEWISGDQIVVYGTAGGAIYTATPSTPATTATFDLVSGVTGDAPYTAFYPTEIATSANTITLSATQTSADGNLRAFPSVAVSNNEILNFKNLCGALRINLTKNGVSVKSIAVTADKVLNGDFMVTMNGDAPTISVAGNNTNTTTLVMEDAQDITNAHDFFVTMPHNMYRSVQVVITAEDGSVCTKTLKDGIGLNIYRSQTSDFVFGENDLDFVPGGVPTGALNGLFSVSANKQVYFSMGNLQYDGANDVWQFAAAQTEFLGAQNNNPTATSVVDLFGWGTSNYNGKAPYMTSTTGTDYGFGTNRNITATQYDWGVNNAIANGGNEANVWRTLTTQEWSYLLSGRTNATALRGIAKVDGVNGIVILPDMWTLPEGMTFNAGSSKTAGWNHNVYTAAEWAQMEAAGAAFLPCNGCRQGANFMLEETAHYWSVSSTSAEKAAAFYFRANDILPVYAEAKWHGHSIRLVQDAE